MSFEANARVRVKTAPDRVGRLTGKVQSHAGRTRYQVDFGTKVAYFPEGNLELAVEQEDEFDLLQKGHYGGVINLRLALTYTRLTGRLADVIYSMEASNTEFLPYQFKPVLNFLDSPSRGILVADEVGLGKTIEAGLIWTELRARFEANRLLVLCPAVLREKWQQELAYRFGVRAEIAKPGDLLKLLKEQAAGAIDGFAAVASLQGLRPPKNWDERPPSGNGAAELAHFLTGASDGEPLFDCVIVDEAHYLRNPATRTHELARLARNVAEHLVLLSATPVQLRSEDLFQLLSLINPENFQFLEAFNEVLDANRPLIELASALRRTTMSREALVEGVQRCLLHPLLGNSRQLAYLAEHPPEANRLSDPVVREQLASRVERVNLLARVVNRTRKRDVQEHRVVRQPTAPQVTMNATEQAFYDEVTDRVRRYCMDRELSEGFILTIPQRQMCSSMPAAMRAWEKKLAEVDEPDLLFESGFDDIEAPTGEGVGPLVAELSRAVGSIASFDELKSNDSKYAVLLEQLQGYWKQYPGHKVIVFSFYRETLHYLRERLEEDGIRPLLLMGGMREPKQEMIDRFRNDPELQVLLASEVASEGVDLQFCSFLVNYDLPWNPMRVEQRIGRIDRIGQKEDRILIWNLFYAGTLDDRIYNRLFLRLDVFRNALGDIEEVLGERMRKLTFSLLSHQLSPEQEAERIDQAQLAIANTKRTLEELEAEAAHLAAHGDYVLNKVHAAREMRRYIVGESLWIYVRDTLQAQFPGTEMTRVKDDPLTVEVGLSQQAKLELRHFMEQARIRANTRLLSSHQGKGVSCVFSNQVDFSSPQHEVVNQYHPLVRFVTSRLQNERFHPLVATTLSHYVVPSIAAGQYLVTAQLWSTRGARVIEKLVFKGVRLPDQEVIGDDDAERLLNAAVHGGRDWPEANRRHREEEALVAYQDLLNRLDDEFNEYVTTMELENEDRLEFLQRTARERMGAQIAQVESIMADHDRRGITRMMKANEGRVRNLTERLEERLALFEKQRAIHTEQDGVTTVLVQVTA